MDTSQPIKVDIPSLVSLRGKTIIVTGASSGIGLETAEFFYELGCNVVFVGGRKKPPTYVPLDSPRVLILQCNIGSWDSQVDVFTAAIAKFGQIDIVCPNAGVAEPQGQYFNLGVDENGRPKPLDMIAYEIDMKGTASTIALAIHYMKAKGGSIIIMSSRAGYAGVPSLPSYSASKHGTFSASFDYDYGQIRIQDGALTIPGATGLLRSLDLPASQINISISLVAPSITFTPGTFPTEYKRGDAAFQEMRTKLKQLGIGLSSSATCAHAVGYLAQGGLRTAGMGLLVDNDEIHNLEQALKDSRPAWWVEKSDNEKSRKEYAKQMAANKSKL